MTQVFNPTGEVVPVTLVQAGPIVVTQLKTKEKDGYEAVQVGFEEKKTKEGEKKTYRHSKEFKTSAEGVTLGQAIDVSAFAENDEVEVSAISKGKGFQGVVKRHGFGGGRRTHGQKHSEREPGAIGGGARAGGRVAKGIRMAGRMGSDRVTIKNLKIVRVDPTGFLLVSGAIPGRRGTLVEIKTA